jgi:hypothetical protein
MGTTNSKKNPKGFCYGLNNLNSKKIKILKNFRFLTFKLGMLNQSVKSMQIFSSPKNSKTLKSSSPKNWLNI